MASAPTKRRRKAQQDNTTVAVKTGTRDLLNQLTGTNQWRTVDDVINGLIQRHLGQAAPPPALLDALPPPHEPRDKRVIKGALPPAL